MQDVVFSETTALSGNAELLRRSLDPVALAQAQAVLARSGRGLAAQAIRPAEERFELYVPSRMPPGGYGLLVFVSPADDAVVPANWTIVLDRAGLICVTQKGAGNDADVIGRREPLALIAEQNVVRRFRIDPRRIWVSGFSGGSRVAMRLAVAYPDVFSGAILNAGSDPIGPGGIALPPGDLAARLRADSRFVYVTGEWDRWHLDADDASLQSMHAQCVRQTYRIEMAHTGHALMDGAALLRAVRILESQGADLRRCGS